MATIHCGYGSHGTAPVLDYWFGAASRTAVSVWNPDGRLSLREWELSGPILGVAPEVAADDEWAVPQGLSMYRRLPTVLYHHTHQSLASVRPVWPIAVMGQEEWPTQPELGPHLFVAA